MIPLARVNGSSAPKDWRLIMCGAKTRAGLPCRLPPVKGRTRCRMHGGSTPRSNRGGAPKGNRNAVVHGYYSAEARMERKRLAAQIRWVKNEMREMRKLKEE